MSPLLDQTVSLLEDGPIVCNRLKLTLSDFARCQETQLPAQLQSLGVQLGEGQR